MIASTCCLVSVHHRPVPYIPVSNRAVIWAEFCGCSTADTPVDVADFHCDLVVGCECSPLFRVVIDDRSVGIVLFPLAYWHCLSGTGIYAQMNKF